MSIFGESAKIMGILRNPNELREAFIVDRLNRLDANTKRNFSVSRECKTMIEEGLLSDESLADMLNRDQLEHDVEIAAVHLAKEEQDPMWDALVKARSDERRLLNDIKYKYHDEAAHLAKNCDKEFTNRIPKSYKK